jgi:hypothetical protein
MIKIKTTRQLVDLVIKLRDEGATEVEVTPERVTVKMEPRRPAAPASVGPVETKRELTAAYANPRGFKEMLPNERIVTQERSMEQRRRDEDELLFNTDMDGTPL